MGVSPMTLNSKGESEDPEGEVSTLATAPEEMLVSPPVGGPAQTTLQVLSPMTPNLGEQMSSPGHATAVDGSDSDAAAYPTSTNSLKPTHPTTNTGQNSAKTPTRPPTLDLGEQMSSPSHATAVDGSDSDAAAFPTTTNSLNPTNPTTNTGQNSPKTPTRPPNAAEMSSRPGPPGPPGPAGLRAETSTCPMLPPTRATSSAWLPHPLLRPSHRRVPRVSPALL
jgi:hypothetical protein